MFYLSLNSGINLGIPFSIVSISPLFIGFLDRIFYKMPLTIIHLIGFILLIISSCSISLAALIDEKLLNNENTEEDLVYKF